MRRVERVQRSNVVKNGYSVVEGELDGSEPCGAHSVEEDAGRVLWDAIV